MLAMVALKLFRTFLWLFAFYTNIFSAFGYDLTIVHNNDVHAHFDQTNVRSGDCSPKDAEAGECYGGEARRVTVIENARRNIPNTVVLDAGDRFVGTLWFTTYKGNASAHFVNREAYDAMFRPVCVGPVRKPHCWFSHEAAHFLQCLGNHEFDFGVEGLLPFINQLTVPVVDANIDISDEPRLQGKIKRSLVIERGGEKIGIVGYITTETVYSASPGPTLKFPAEIPEVRAEVEKLKGEGVKIIIGLSHSGYEIDKKVAAEVDGIDVIVGGHTHTFLYTGDQPSTELIEGPYPTIVRGPSGKNVLVVQAYAWGKYMGFLNVTFDENFDVQNWSGNPILLDNSIPRDNDTLADIIELGKPLEETRNLVVGSTAVLLDGERSTCRLRECNAGNLITDAMIWYHIDNKQDNDSWALASIALHNAGGIRASTIQGPISLGQVLTVIPFGNTIELISLKGVHVRQMMEHSVSKYDPLDPTGGFLQISGLRVKYDLSKPPGSRVVSLEARCLRCQTPTYSPVEDEVVYKILTITYLVGGGDQYDVIKDNIIDHVRLFSMDADVLSGYLTSNKLVFPETEGRILFVSTTSNETSTLSPTSTRLPPSTPLATENPIIVHTCPGTSVNTASIGHLNLSVTLLSICGAFVFSLRTTA